MKEESQMADRVGQQFGNYRLIQLLGSGGFAEVYLAEHRQLGMKAAIKILHTHLASDEISAFRQEARRKPLLPLLWCHLPDQHNLHLILSRDKPALLL
jgi:serine/threonine protein kinase